MILLISQLRIGDTYRTSSGHHDLKCRMEDMTGCPVLVQHYSRVTPELVERLPLRAILIGGTSVPWSEINLPDMHGVSDVITTTRVPMLGLCGGHQLIGVCFNNDLRSLERLDDARMRALAPGEPDLNPDYHPGLYVEAGMWPVEIVADDPIFAGLGRTIMVRQSHASEVKQLPPGFIHLARNDNCEIQAMRHAGRILYGTQFHPEVWTDYYPDGKRLMENFFRLAGVID